MEVLEELEKIEYVSDSRKDSNWFYHGFDYTDATFKAMLTEGIKCPYLLEKVGSGSNYNGKYFVSVSKEHPEYSASYTAYSHFLNTYPVFIIAGVKAFHCIYDNFFIGLLKNTRIPLRTSHFKDEYQALDRIDPKFIVGIECKLYKWYQEQEFSLLAYYLAKMIEIMDEYSVNIPVYDFSRERNGVIHEVDKEKYLQFSYKVNKRWHDGDSKC